MLLHDVGAAAALGCGMRSGCCRVFSLWNCSDPFPLLVISVIMRCVISGADLSPHMLLHLPVADYGCASADGIGLIAMLTKLPNGSSIHTSPPPPAPMAHPSDIAAAIILRLAQHPVIPTALQLLYSIATFLVFWRVCRSSCKRR